jgi:hypothetical protein
MMNLKIGGDVASSLLAAILTLSTPHLASPPGWCKQIHLFIFFPSLLFSN